MWDNLLRLGEDVSAEEDDQNNQGENRKWLHDQLNGTLHRNFNGFQEFHHLLVGAGAAETVRDLETLGLSLSRAGVFVRAPGTHGGDIVFD